MRTLSLALFAVLAVSCKSTTTSDMVVPYPLDTCIVTQNDLGSMGDPIVKVYNGQEVKFCCGPCVAEFEAHMDTYLPLLSE